MPEMQTARESLSHLLVGLKDVDEAVVRGEKRFGEHAYAIAYVDFADEVIQRSQQLRDFQERILGDDFFDAPGDLRWNKYLYLVAGPNSTSNPQFAAAKAAIEADRDYARKRVVSAEDLESLLGAAEFFDAADGGATPDVLADWRRRLAAGQLELLLDCPTPRTAVVEKIAKREAGRPAAAGQRVNDLHQADRPIAKSMLLSLTINSFRPVHDGKTYDFGKVTLVTGANGTGKTSLLEAIERLYCGNNLRSKSTGVVRIKGRLAPIGGGDVSELQSISDGPRLKARCLAWYNRKEFAVDAIVDSFSQYNFLDTDAAFRLSANLQPTDVATELSRLLVGATAATTFDYLEKIYGDVEKAVGKAEAAADKLQYELHDLEKRLRELQGRPSNAKTLAEAYRAALVALEWKSSPDADAGQLGEGPRLLAALGHIQALSSLGDAARTIGDIERRSSELGAALEAARPHQERLSALHELEAGLVDGIEAHERNAEMLSRRLVYETSGFLDVRTQYFKARDVADALATRLKSQLTGDIPEIPVRYAELPIEVALQSSDSARRDAEERLASAKIALDLHGKAASARAAALKNLKSAALTALQQSQHPNTCPVCHTVHPDGALMHLIEELNTSADSSAELNALVNVSSQADLDAREARKVAAGLEYCQKTANLVGLKGSTPKAILNELAGLQLESDKARAEVQRLGQEGKALREAGLSSDEHDSLWNRISHFFEQPENGGAVIGAAEVLRSQNDAAEGKRKELLTLRRHIDVVVEEIRGICRTIDLDGWSTHVQPINSFASLVALQEEFRPAADNVVELSSYLDAAGIAPLAELKARVASVASACSEAVEALRSEVSNSEELRVLPPAIERTRLKLSNARGEADALDTARNLLDDLIANASLKSATQEALETIGCQIDEVFSRIHSPKEYEYVGSSDVLLRSVETQKARTLDQVSTGQRAAFALSIFLARNRTATNAPPILLIDDPIAHIDDLNALSFLDYLRDLAVNSGRQIFFATADTRVASLFSKKFSFLGDDFKTISLVRAPRIVEAVTDN
ncbi:DNA replication and repair protein RecF [Comamonas sp. PE63]|uniref:DNA replication and repair protein RecF n=2 Tax=Comamonas brasiliensis TaxID=1812482 RepID=A0ABS5LM17_9BURK|nr:DNA replication and repair protein RecF [Comamonas sp. PE63]